MPYQHCRVVRFHETDAAGVVYFANVLMLCHEAYEASLAAAGFDLGLYFSQAGDIAVPVVHTQSDFYQPLRCGDVVTIFLTPTQLTEHSFEISYQLYHRVQAAIAPTQKAAAIALTRHLCIDPNVRRRQPLPPELTNWIKSLAEPAAPND
ncbi:MAG: thioesterase family protein [Cyanobacteria bacterium P01_D01_bin.36]